MFLQRIDTLRHLFLQDTEPQSQSAQLASAHASPEVIIHTSFMTKQHLKAEATQKGETKRDSTDEETPIALQMPDDTTTSTESETPYKLPPVTTRVHAKNKDK